MNLTDPAVVIVGAGGMGALFGAILQQGGLHVTLYDTDQEHLDAIQRDGLHISGYGGERVVRIPVTVDSTTLPSADLLLFQCKSHATTTAARAVGHLAERGAVCISFQNGLGNEEAIAAEVGDSQVLGGLTAMAGYRLGPGRIHDFSRVPSWIGEMSGGLSDRSTAIAQRLTEAGLETHASADIRLDIWKKLLGNLAMSAVSGSTNLTSVECLRIPELCSTSYRALDEALAVARAVGIELDRDEAVHGLELITAAGGTGDNKSSLCVDVQNRRPTEIDYIYGSVIRLAHRHGIAVPTLETLAAIIKGLESHYLPTVGLTSP